MNVEERVPARAVAGFAMRKVALPTPPPLRALCLIAALAMTVQIFFLAEPAFASKAAQVFWDKTVHFVFFGLVAFFLWISTAKRWPLAIWAVVLLVGVIDETRQAYVPGRNSDINDVLADGFGAAAALIIAQRSTKSGD